MIEAVIAGLAQQIFVRLAIFAAVLFIVGGTVGWVIGAFGPATQRCVFDRNEPGPRGEYGQWWWDVYKCTDGTERRELVAGPRG